ncbi:MAG TPA: iron-sulfur cluster assembly scaffold protein [Bryobacteraceae bacterium]|nr:iron-sulfur cluster assembly scaffold protein [Bryobacteraceae bacterium]
MYSAELLKHFQNPRNVGELEAPARMVEVINPACGDILRLWARFEGGRIVEVAYKTRGCTASIAAGSALTELLLGLGIAELPGITAAKVEAAVGGLPPASRHAAGLCADAVQALMK